MHPETRFLPDQYALFAAGLARLQQMEPLQYILGEAWFDGLKLQVGPGVLIPRPETEELVEWASSIDYPSPSPQILDLCTGSGCIALALQHRLPHARVHALEYHAPALAYARANAQALRLPIHIIEADLLQSRAGDFKELDAIVCNPPYIPAAEASVMDQNVLAHEPSSALFVPDDDPLRYYNKVSALGRHWLRPGGRVFFEVHEERAQAVAGRLRADGYEEVEVRKDLQGKERMVAGTKSPAF